MLTNKFKKHFFQKIGGKQDNDAAQQYILKMYLKTNPDPDRMCYSHFTVATGWTKI